MSVAVEFQNVSKEYRLGNIGRGTLRADVRSFTAKILGKEDPNERIGAKHYGKNERFYALDGVSFKVEEGEVLGLIGGNGAGKSTLLKLLSRITVPTQGKITYAGKVAGMLEIGTGFHPEMTGRENVYLNGAILGMSVEEINKKFDDIVEFSEVGKFIDTPVKRYSSGMFVKLAFSVAAHLDSDIMLMDEVLAVGDVRFREKCMDKMMSSAKREGKTVIYVSHNMDTVRRMCRRCVVLDAGKLVYDGDTEEAIGIYSENVCKPTLRQEYTESKSPSRIVSMSVLDGVGEYCSDAMSLGFGYVSDRRAGVRLEIKTASDAPVGAYIARNCVTPGEGEVGLEFDISCLPDGMYRTSVGIYDEETGEDTDVVCGLCFSIRRGRDAYQWNHTWGRVKLPEPRKL